MKKTYSVVLALFLLAFVILTIVLETAESAHECDGEGCPICHLLMITQDNLLLLGLSFSAAALYILVFMAATECVSRILNIQIVTRTLVSQKVRLND